MVIILFLLCSVCCFSNAVVTLNTFYDPHLIFNISRVDHFCTLSQIITMSLSVCLHYPGAAVETYRKRGESEITTAQTSKLPAHQQRRTAGGHEAHQQRQTVTASKELQRTTVWQSERHLYVVCKSSYFLLPDTWIRLESSWKWCKSWCGNYIGHLYNLRRKHALMSHLEAPRLCLTLGLCKLWNMELDI